MATEEQIAANKENAKNSTGPRTEEGKATSSGNAVKHGLTAKDRVVLVDESQEQFEAIRRDLIDEMQTGTALEKLLIEEIAASAWRLRRAARIERDMMDEDLREPLANHRYRELRREVEMETERREAEEEGEQAVADFVARWAESEPDPDDPLCDRIRLGEEVRKRLIADDAYAKLGRYEVRLRRGLFQAVRELRLLRGQFLQTMKGCEHRSRSGVEYVTNPPYAINPYSSTFEADYAAACAAGSAGGEGDGRPRTEDAAAWEGRRADGEDGRGADGDDGRRAEGGDGQSAHKGRVGEPGWQAGE